MGLFDIFKTSTKAVDVGLDLVKTGAKGIDMLFYTDEEKAQASAGIAKLKLEYAKLNVEHVKATLGESSARSISRRYIAWGVIGQSIFLSTFSLIMYALGAVFDNQKLMDVSDYALELLKLWSAANLMVLAFYFGVHLLRGLKK